MNGRRGRGEGSIYRRADGRWTAYVTLEDGGRRYLYGRTRQDVALKLSTALKTRNDGLPLPSDKETVASFLTTWVGGQRHRLRPGTWRRYEQYVRVHAVPVIGRVALAKLGPQHLERLYEDRQSAGLSPTTVHHLHTALHKAFSQAVRGGLLVRNPSDLVDPPRIARREMAVLSAEQVKQLLAAAAGEPLVRQFFRVQDWLYDTQWTALLGSILIVGFLQEFLKYCAIRYTVFDLDEFD